MEILPEQTLLSFDYFERWLKLGFTSQGSESGKFVLKLVTDSVPAKFGKNRFVS